MGQQRVIVGQKIYEMIQTLKKGNFPLRKIKMKGTKKKKRKKNEKKTQKPVSQVFNIYF